MGNEELVIDEASFHNAINNCSAFARKRLFKKMGKTNKKTGLPPKDLEAYVTSFVRTHFNPEWKHVE